MANEPHAKYRVGVIGGGRKGTQHARAYALNPSTEVVAIADNDQENLDLFCSRFKVPGYSDYREMLSKERIEIAAPVLPVKPNPDVVLACAQADVKAILCEKPLAASLEDADRLVEACQSRGIKFGAGDMDRNLPQYWQTKELIDSGEIGEVLNITFMYGSGTEMSGGGCQIFSLMRLFAGDADVAWTIGWVADDPASDYDQGVAGYVRFVNGIEAFMQRSAGATREFEVRCTRGVIRNDGTHLHVSKAGDGGGRPGSVELEELDGLFSEPVHGAGFASHFDEDGWTWPGDRQVATVQSIVDALEQNIEPRSSGDNGRKVLEIAIGLRESHRQGHAPVRFPLEDRTLKIMPHDWRYLNKKPLWGREKYMPQVLGQTKQ